MTHHSNPDSHIVSPGVLYHNSLTLQISNDLLDFTLSVGVFDIEMTLFEAMMAPESNKSICHSRLPGQQKLNIEILH